MIRQPTDLIREENKCKIYKEEYFSVIPNEILSKILLESLFCRSDLKQENAKNLFANRLYSIISVSKLFQGWKEKTSDVIKIYYLNFGLDSGALFNNNKKTFLKFFHKHSNEITHLHVEKVLISETGTLEFGNKNLSNYPKMVYFNAEKTVISCEGVKKMVALFPNLQVLKIPVNDICLEIIRTNLKQLKKLHCNPNFATEFDFCLNILAMSQLEKLVVFPSNTTAQLSKNGINSIANKHKNLKTIILYKVKKNVEESGKPSLNFTKIIIKR